MELDSDTARLIKSGDPSMMAGNIQKANSSLEPGTGIPINLLLVVDSTAVVEQITNSLTLAGYEPSWHQAATELELLELLDGAPDMIVADAFAAKLSPARAMQVVASRGVWIPLVLLVDRLVEGESSAFLRQGVFDCVSRDALARLGWSTARALAEKSLRQSSSDLESDLRNGQERYRRLVNLSPVAIVIHAQGKVMYANRAAMTLIGAESEDQLYERDVLSFVHPDYHALISGRLQRKQDDMEEVDHLFEKLVRLDGTVIDVEVAAIPILYQGVPATQAVIVDVSQHLQTKQALAESEHRYRQIIESAIDVIYVVGVDGRFTYVNPQSAALTGYSTKELIGMHFRELVGEQWRERLSRLYDNEFRSGKSDSVIEIRITTKDGQSKWIEQTTTPLTVDGLVTGFQSIAREITKRKRAELASEQSELRYRTLFEAAYEAVVLQEEDRILEVNRAFESMFGCTRQQAIGRSIVEFIPTEVDATRWGDNEPNGNSPLETAGLRQDGGEIDLEIRGKDVDYQGKLVRVTAIRDITAHKQAEAAEREQRRFAEALAATTAVLNQSLDLDQVLDHILENVGAVVPHDAADIMLLTGGEARVVRSRGYDPFHVPEAEVLNMRLPLASTSNLFKMAETGEPLVFNDIRQLDDWVDTDVSFWIRSYAGAPIRLTGVVIGFLNLNGSRPNFFSKADGERLKVFADQAAVAIENARLYELAQLHTEELEKRVAERTSELQTANMHLLELAKVKDQFVSNVSHELRTPITSIKLYHQLLTLNPAKSTDYIETLHRETMRLETIVEDLLFLSRLDQDAVKFKLALLDVNELVGRFVVDRSLLASSRSLELIFSGCDDMGMINADRHQFGKVISVLLTNAISYTQSGGTIQVTTRLVNRDGKAWAAVDVTDNGPGITPDEQAKLFGRFYRGNASRNVVAPGTGLGLAIAKQIMDHHGGIIEVASKGLAGEGASFTVMLPA